MRQLVLMLISLFFVLWACQNKRDKETVVNSDDSTTVEFEQTSYDFGEITQGEAIKHIFYFKNTGKKPLFISEVHSSCGCTIADYSTKPIAPGEKGYVEVTFNSAGKSGKQYKTVTIMMNTMPPKNIIQITGNVKTENN